MSTMKHILFTMKGCAYHLLDDEAHVRTMLANATVMANAELLDITSHKFSPFGVTAVALLAESHISIHTSQRNSWQYVMFSPVAPKQFLMQR